MNLPGAIEVRTQNLNWRYLILPLVIKVLCIHTGGETTQGWPFEAYRSINWVPAGIPPVVKELPAVKGALDYDGGSGGTDL